MKFHNFFIFLILIITIIQSEATKIWFPSVNGFNKNDSNNGYAGSFGKPITGLRVSGGQWYRVHIKGGSWLSPVKGNNPNDNKSGYAGTINGSVIDAVSISGGVQYAVHLQGRGWLPFVNGYSIYDSNNGYAGIIGSAIDAIMIKGRTYATSYGTGGVTTSPTPTKIKTSSIIIPTQTPTTEAQKVKTIYSYIKSKVPAATKNGIAAILGNWSIESGIESKRAEGDYYNPPIGTANNRNSYLYDDNTWLNMSGPQIYNGNYPRIIHRGLGLGQWTDTPDASRNTELRKYANKKGKKWYDLTLQLDFLLYGDNQYAISIVTGILKSNESINTLTERFLAKWEGVAGNKLSQRQTEARRIYNTYLSKY